MRKSGSTKNADTGNTEEKILKESMRLFLERGYHGTSIDDITQAAGLTKGALYWHFKNKEALLRKIIEKYEKSFLDGLIHAISEVKGGALDKFEKYISFNAGFAYYNREVCLSFQTLAPELVGSHHRIEFCFRRIYKKHQKFLSELIRQGKKEGVFRKELDTDLTALTIIAFHSGVLIQWSINSGRLDELAFLRTLKGIMINGLMQQGWAK